MKILKSGIRNNRAAAAVALLFTTLCVIFSAAPVSAHHAYATEFDTHSPLTLTGKITRVEWMNPHIYFYVDAKDDSGKSVHYAVQAGAPTALNKLGWRSTSLKPGDIVTVVGYKSRDGWNRMNARDVTFPDGRKVFIGAVDPAQHN